MVKVNIKDKEYYIDGILKSNLDHIKNSIKKDWDYVFIVDGEVGSGKSVFAQQIAHYCCDGELNLTEICFNPEQFKQAVLNSKKYNAIIFDEAFRGLSARAAMTQTNRVVVSMLQEIRQRNLFVFIVLPSIWDLDKYVALHRCKGLFHVHTDNNKTRGYFKFYKKDKITMMMANPMKWRYRYPNAPQFKGRFTNFYPIGEEEYKKKKWNSLGEYGYEKEEADSKLMKKTRERLAICLQNWKKFEKVERIADKLGVNRNTVTNLTNLKTQLSSSNLESGGGDDDEYTIS